MNYFDKLPTISYDGVPAKNLLARARLSDKTKSNKTAFYPYTMDGYDRPDILSNLYYDDPGYSWLIWFSNDIIDPYYDSPLSDQDFYSYIVDKYGSEDTALRKIYFYRTNWYNNEEQISPSAYEGLTGTLKKFWEPVVDNLYNPIAYKRKQEDILVSTNKILSLSVTSVSNTFTVGEEVQIDTDNYAFVTSSNTSYVICQHISGAITANSTYTPTITGQESGTTATVVSSTTLSSTIPDAEITYWEPVSYYQYETEINEKKKEIKLLDVRYRDQAEDDLKRVMLTR